MQISSRLRKYKLESGLPLDIFMRLKPIFAELSDESLLEECLYGKTQNKNGSFNSVIWDCIPETWSLEVYDKVATFNKDKKASVLVYEKWIWHQESLPCNFVIQSIVNDVLLQ